jgi:hypothetical protein
LVALGVADIQRILAIRRYWEAGIRPGDLAPRYIDADIAVDQARDLQCRPEEWDNLRSMVESLAAMRSSLA